MRWETTCFGTAGGQGPYDDRELLARDDLHCAIIPTPCYWYTTMYCDALDAGMTSMARNRWRSLLAGSSRSWPRPRRTRR